MTDIKDKIAKLLALADSPSEHEARAALLKARELMVQYKLRPEDCVQQKSERVTVEGVGIHYTSYTDCWAGNLAAVIAPHYCCKWHRYRRKNGKSMEIGFAGLEDDFAVCKRIFLYAYDCVKTRCKELAEEHRKLGWTSREIRELCNAYGWGFCTGLKAAYLEQEQAHQEWGLVLVVPQAVEDATSHYKKARSGVTAKTGGWRKQFVNAGYAEGQQFDPGSRLEQSQEQSDRQTLLAGTMYC